MASAGAGRVVIAGGTGFVGGEVVKTFQRLGYETFVISRHEKVNTAKTPDLLFSANKTDLKNIRTWADIEVNINKAFSIEGILFLDALLVSINH